MSAIEAGINLVGPVLLDVTVNGHSTRRPDFPTGNRLEWPHAAPHGVYPARGDDRWVAIAVFDDDQWAGLVDALGNPDWTADARFATQDGSVRATRTPSTSTSSAWTRDRDRHDDHRAAAGGTACRRGRCRTPRTSTSATRRSPTAACSSRWTTR